MRGGVATAGRPLQPTVAQHPFDLLGEQEQGRERGRVVGLVEARLLECDRQVEARGHPAARRGDALDARGRGGRTQRKPESAVAGEALLWSEVVHVELVGDDAEPARSRRRVDDDEPVGLVGAYHREHDAGRRLVVREGVHVDIRVGLGDGSGTRRALDHLGIFEMRCRAHDSRELRRELAAHEMLRAPLDEPKRRGVPERGRTAVAEQHFVAVGEREQSRETIAHPAHDRPDAGPAVARTHVPGRGVGQRANGLLAHFRRSGTEPAVRRQEIGGQGDRGGGISRVGHPSEVSEPAATRRDCFNPIRRSRRSLRAGSRRARRDRARLPYR